METALFWIIWGLVSFGVLRTFYYSFSKGKFERLRKAAFGTSFATLILTFLPWLPPNLGGKSGFALATQGNVPMLLFLVLLVVSILFLLLKNSQYLKLSAAITIVNTFLLFVIMYRLRPGTYILTLYDIAPIVAILLLLITNVAVLLLWQQLKLKIRK